MFEWALPKDHVLVRESEEKRRNRKLHAWKRPTADGTVLEVKEATILGETLTRKVSESPAQVNKVVKAMAVATNGLRWLCFTNAMPCLEVVNGLLQAMVGSLARAGLVIVRMTDSQASKVESVVASFGRDLLGLSSKVGVWEIFTELGWRAVRREVYYAKLGLLGRLWRAREKDRIIDDLLGVRVRQVEDGDEMGLLGELWEELSALGHEAREMLWWPQGLTSKKEWKKRAGNAADEIEHLKWMEFKARLEDEECGGLKRRMTRERSDYLNEGLSKDQVQRIAAVRLNDTCLAKHRGLCGACEEQKDGSLFHLMLDCSATSGPREQFWIRVHEGGLGGRGWAELVEGGEDLAIYVEEVCRIFKAKTGKVLLRGRALMPDAHSWEEATQDAASLEGLWDMDVSSDEDD
jgi:hypothetical protein